LWEYFFPAIKKMNSKDSAAALQRLQESVAKLTAENDAAEVLLKQVDETRKTLQLPLSLSTADKTKKYAVVIVAVVALSISLALRFTVFQEAKAEAKIWVPFAASAGVLAVAAVLSHVDKVPEPVKYVAVVVLAAAAGLADVVAAAQ